MKTTNGTPGKKWRWCAGLAAVAASIAVAVFALSDDTDGDGWPNALDNNPLSRACMRWGLPQFTTGDVYQADGPAWWVGAWKTGGDWGTNPSCWRVRDGETNAASLLIDLDRALLTNDPMLRLDYFDHSDASLYVDLYDAGETTVAVNLFGNLMHGSLTDVSSIHLVPLGAYPSAVGIELRRGAGEITVYESMLYVDQDGDGLDEDQEAQLGTSDLLADTDGDGIGDYAEACFHGTLPTDPFDAPGRRSTLAGGSDFTLLVRRDGSAWSWGYNLQGQLGLGTSAGFAAAASRVHGVGDVGFFEDAAFCALGWSHALVVATDGTIWAWGQNGYGRLGDNTTTERTVPIQVHGFGDVGFFSNVVAAAAGEAHSLALAGDGTVWAWGANGDGQLGDNTETTRKTPIPVHGLDNAGYLSNIVAIAAGRNFSLAVDVDGAVWAWGANTQGQLADGSTTRRKTPVRVHGPCNVGFLANVRAVAGGWSHALAVKNDGTAWAWGDNASGQLGDNTTSTRTVPVQVHGPGDAGFLTNVVAVAGARLHSLALKADGTVWAFGDNGFGRLGDNTTTERRTPVQVHGRNNVGYLQNAIAVAAGERHSLAFKADGTVWAWGNNEYGELGDGTTDHRYTPVLVDSDADGLPDDWEFARFGDLDQAAAGDADNDGLSNLAEYQAGTDPLVADNDGDGVNDAAEIAAGTDPLDPNSCPSVPVTAAGTISYSGSQPGTIHVVAPLFSNLWESPWSGELAAPGAFAIENVPTRSNCWIKAYRDSNANGSNDAWEAQGVCLANPIYLTAAASGLDVTLSDPDADADGLPDWWEIARFGSLDQTPGSDADNDGLSNLEEYQHGTDPLAVDSDNDGMGDGTEFSLGHDPAASNAYGRLPFVELFEPDTVACGELDGQNFWQAAPASAALVQSNVVYAGTQALELAADGATATVSRVFGAAGCSTVWLDLRLKVRPAAAPAAPREDAVAFLFDADGRLVVQDGSKPQGQEWVTLTNHAPVSLGAWARVTVRADCAVQTWTLWLDGVQVAEGLGFAAPRGELHFLAVEGSHGYADDVSVGANVPEYLSTNGDNLPDAWELQHFGNLAQNDSGDPDADGVANLQEYQRGTDPTEADTDNDGVNDAVEISAGTDPLDPNSCPSVPVTLSGTVSYAGPQTGIVRVVAATTSNLWESSWSAELAAPGAFAIEGVPTRSNYWVKTYRDSNGNGSNDGWEAQGVCLANPIYLTNAASGLDVTLSDPDADADGLPDWWEVARFGSLDQTPGADADNDGLSNLQEYQLGTNPFAADTDNDGVSDGAEISAGTDPLDPNSCPSVPVTLAGTISYSGPQTGVVRVVAVTASNLWESAWSGELATPGAFAIEGVPTRSNYWLKAYCDANANGSNDVGEAQGVCLANPIYLTNAASGLDVTLADLDADADGLPDWWEVARFGSLDPMPGADADNDGLTNLEEYQHGTEPTAADTDNDGLADGDELVWGLDPTQAETLAAVPWSADFEAAEGYAEGSLAGQQGWVVPRGTAAVETQTVFAGSQAIALSPDVGEAIVGKFFAPVTGGVVWTECRVRMTAGALPTNVLPGVTAVFGVDPQGCWAALDGTEWRAAESFPATDTWTRVTVRHELDARRWDLYIGARKALADLSFADPTAARFTRFALVAGTNAFVDSAAVNLSAPGHVDMDGDGLTNEEEAQAGTDPLASDSDGDGMSDAAELKWGFNPAVSNAFLRFDAASGITAWQTGFEASEGYATGELDGQNGWTASAGVQVSDADKHQGLQSVLVPGLVSTNGAGRRLRLNVGAAGQSVVWAGLYTRLPQSLPADPLRGQPAAVKLCAVGNRLNAYDGVLHNWRQSPPMPGLTNGWVRLDVRADFSNKQYRAYVNGMLALDEVNFQDPSVTEFARVEVVGSCASSSANVWLDDLYLALDEPSDGLDFDGDGLSNARETQLGTDPDNADSDADGLPDGWEVDHGLNPLLDDAALDPDTDGLSNAEEYAHGTNPQAADSDADGMPDAWEVANGLDPLTNDASADPDADGLANLAEYQQQTDPLVADSDGDGLSDGYEVNTSQTDPLVADSDGDGYSDGVEVSHGFDPNSADSRPMRDWSHALKLTLRTNEEEALSDVPVLVRITPGRVDYAQFAAGGTDLRFTDAASDPLDFEVEQWNPSGETIVWVRLPQVGGTNAPGHFFMYWGNPAATNAANSAGVWPSYAGVWHLGETNDVVVDSAPSRYDAVNGGAVSAEGILGGARSFGGSDTISIPAAAFASIGDAVTISFWLYGVAERPYKGTCLDGYSLADRQLNVALPWDDGNVYWDAFGNFDRVYKAAGPNEYKGRWNQWTFTKDRVAGTMAIYLNGELWAAATGKTLPYTPVTAFWLGSAANGSFGYVGRMDEFRVETVARSAAWNQFQYRSMTDQALIWGDQVVSVAASVAAAEPNQAGEFTFTRSSTATNLPLAVNFTLDSGTAAEGLDFAVLPRTVVIPAGSLQATLSVPVLDDFWLEGAETVTVRLADGDYFTDPANAAASLAIADNDQDTDGDGLCDEWEMLHFGNLDRDGSGDADSDGLSDRDEYLNRTNPHAADTDGDGMPDAWEVANGLDPVTNDASADADGDGLTNLQEYQQGTNPCDVDFDGDGMPDGWEIAHGLNPADPSDAALDPDNDGLTNLGEYQAGSDPHAADTDGDGLSDGDEVNTYHTDPTKADTDGDGVPDDWELANGLNPLDASDGGRDTDGDGLSDYDEAHLYGTDPTKADTDGDGVSDREEVMESLTNPLVAEFDGTVVETRYIPGSQVSAAVGDWTVKDGGVNAGGCRGWVEYQFDCPAGDMYRVSLEATHIWLRSTCIPVDPVSSSDLEIFLDGEYLGRKTLVAPDGIYGAVRFFTPWVKSGQHVLRVRWENVNGRVSLRIRDVRLQSLGGPDANANGVKDWVEASIAAMAGVDPNQQTSVVSPMCLEGRERYVGMMTISNAPSGAWQPVTVRQGTGDRWFANVPLSSTAATPVSVGFQHGALRSDFSITWAPRNVLAGGTLRVRAGDTVMFTAAPAGATSGSVQIRIDGDQTYNSSIGGAPILHTFDEAGTFTVTGSHESGASGSMTVQALAGSFPAEAPACMLGQARPFVCTNLPPEAVLEADPSVEVSWLEDTLTLKARSTNRRHVLLARVEAGGAILAATDVNAFWVQAAVDNFMRVVDHTESAQIWENTILTRNVPSDVALQLKIIVGGVTFDDLSIERWVTAADLDELGEYSFRMIHPNSIGSSTCHIIRLYQNGQFIGEAYYSGRLMVDE